MGDYFVHGIGSFYVNEVGFGLPVIRAVYNQSVALYMKNYATAKHCIGSRVHRIWHCVVIARLVPAYTQSGEPSCCINGQGGCLCSSGFPPAARMTAGARMTARRPRPFWRLTAPRAVILELARESSKKEYCVPIYPGTPTRQRASPSVTGSDEPSCCINAQGGCLCSSGFPPPQSSHVRWLCRPG